MKKRLLRLVIALAFGAEFGAAIGLYSFATSVAVAPASVSTAAEPSDEMVERMSEWGADRGGQLFDVECYSAPPVTACIATYFVAAQGRTAQVPWVFKQTPDGLEAY